MAITIVNATSINGATSGTIPATTAGNCLIVVVTVWASNTPAVTGVTLGGVADNFSSLISQTGADSADFMGSFIWADPACAGGQTTVAATVTVTGGINDSGMYVLEVAGAASSSVLDKSSGGGGNGTSWSSGTTALTSTGGEIWVGAIAAINPLTSTPSGWTLSSNLSIDAGTGLQAAYQLASAKGAATFAGTQQNFTSGGTTFDGWAAAVVTILPGPPPVSTHGTMALAPMTMLAAQTAFAVTNTGTMALAPMSMSAGALLKTVKTTGPFGANDTPGPSSCQPGNTAGNLLVIFAAWDVTNSSGANATVPCSSVGDDAGNWWRLAVDSGTSIEGCRCAIWFCANALAITRWLSFAPAGNVASYSWYVTEFSGAPANYNPVINYGISNVSSSASSLVTNTTASSPDYVFALGAVGSGAISVSGPGAGFADLTAASQADPNGVSFLAAFGSFGAESVTATWSYGASGQVAAVMCGLSQQNDIVAQPNANFPAIKVEAAFGSLPGSPSQAILDTAWTDLSSRCISPDGVAGISISRGQQYELSQPEAGTITISINNVDAALDPGNASSPYYPNVVLGTPIRVSAFWQGRRYPLAFGYVERWPQTWPSLRQWGFSPMVATDVVGVASSTQLPSAVQGQILCDNPYFCFPFSEQYSSGSSTLNGVVLTPANADGLIAINTSRANQKTSTYINGAAADVATGLSMGLLGDSGTAMGASSYQAPDGSGGRGTGAIYGPDGGLPSWSNSGSEVTFEFWLNVPVFNGSSLPGGFAHLPIYHVSVLPYIASNGASTISPGYLTNIYWRQIATTSLLGLSISWSNTAFNSSFSISGDSPIHNVINLTSGGTINWWVNGTLVESITTGTPPYGQLAAFSFGQAGYSYGASTSATGIGNYNFNYSFSYGTLYSYSLSQSQITDHYNSGITGFSGDSLLVRAGRYLSWANLNLNLAGFGIADALQLAPAYSTANSALSDALNTDITTDGGKWYGNAFGNLVILPRPALYDLPSVVTFSDNSTDIAGGAISYETGLGFDYDNSYVYNVTQATLSQGPNTLISPVEKDFTSINSYFQRGPLTQSVQGLSLQDAYDRAFWSLQFYKQPSMRVQQLIVEAASKPVSFTTLLQTDVTTIATVKRTPVGSGVTYTLPVVIQKVQHEIGPGKWTISYQMSPYTLYSNALTADSPGFDTLGSSSLAW